VRQATVNILVNSPAVCVIIAIHRLSITADAGCYTRLKQRNKIAKITNGDITLAALCHCQRASKIISPFIIFALFDASFRRYNL